MCRKSSGSAFATYGTVLIENLSWVGGYENIKVFRSSEHAQRGFCGNCGSSLFYKRVNDDSGYEMSLGVLDEEPNYFPSANINCEERAKWSEQSEQLRDFVGDRETI
jgi:hypothetical protein